MHSPRWAALLQFFRVLFQADPHYHWENDWSMDPWKPPSEVRLMPALPFVVNGKTMGLDPSKILVSPMFRVSR